MVTSLNAMQIIPRLLAGRYLAFSAAVFLLTISSLLEATAIFSAAPLIDLITQPNLENPNKITIAVLAGLRHFGLSASVPSLLLVYFLVLVFKNVVAGTTQFVIARVHFHQIRQLITDLFASFLRARWHFFVFREHGTLGNVIVRHTEKAALYLEALAELLSALLRLLFYAGAAFIVSWQLTLQVGFLGAICLVPFFLLGRYVNRIGTRHTMASNELQGTVVESLSAIKLILGYANQHKSHWKLERSLGPFMSTAVQFIMIRLMTPLAFEPLSVAVAGFAAYQGLYHYGMALSELYILLYSLRSMLSLGNNIVNQRNSLLNSAPALTQLYHLKDEAEQTPQVSGQIPFNRLDQQVEFSRVSFSYPGQNAEVLNAVSLVIPRGKMVALVGRSGAGKTTLVDILMGFYEPSEGVVLVDGVPMQHLAINSWRHHIGFVPQDAFLFNMSLRDNLLWSRDNASRAELHEACRQANAMEFIENLPEGFDTLVGERGIRLSGGQRQRIALARALLRRPELLILDEATSALDSHSERMIQESIDRISRHTTIVVIAHRLSTIQKADRIYVLNEGKVAQSGTFPELMGRDGNFLKMAQLQGFEGKDLVAQSE